MIGPVKGTSATVACTSWGMASRDKTRTRVRRKQVRMRCHNTTTALRMRMFSKTLSTSAVAKATKKSSLNSAWTLKSRSFSTHGQVTAQRELTIRSHSRQIVRSAVRTAHLTQLMYRWMTVEVRIKDQASPTEDHSGVTSSRHRSRLRSLTHLIRRFSKLGCGRRQTMAYPVRCRLSKKRLSKAARRRLIAIQVERSARGCSIS